MGNANRVCDAILFIIVYQVLTAESDRCFEANQGLSSGCSIPVFKNFPFKNHFTPPCERHDICYNCGSKFRKSRLYCDILFLQDMHKVCKRMSFWMRLGCNNFALHVYYKAVRRAGFLFFKMRPVSKCNQTWVPSCFP